MAGGIDAVFSELDDYRAALGAEGVVSMSPTRCGEFRARLTQVTLRRLSLSISDERLPRIAFIAAPPEKTLVCFVVDDHPVVWGGVNVSRREIVSFGRGYRVHMRTDGPCAWGLIQISSASLTQYGRVLRGPGFVIPCAARWRPPFAALRRLRQLHRTVYKDETRAAMLTNNEAVHGLEQQVIHALVECLSGPLDEAAEMDSELIARFEGLLTRQPLPRIADMIAALGVSGKILDESCLKHLGMRADGYRRLRGMQEANRALRMGDRSTASVSEVARQCGFRDVRRFSAEYRALYGETPSSTLQRSVHGVMIVT